MNNKEVEQGQTEMQETFNKLLLANNKPFDDYKFVAIGYLDSSEPFEKGEVSINFLIFLRGLWEKGLTLGSLGFYECDFCEGKKATSSSEKILIDKENNIKYIFPEMIFHYIKAHKFKPCDEFIEFVMRK